jgi:hypothetical protein
LHSVAADAGAIPFGKDKLHCIPKSSTPSIAKDGGFSTSVPKKKKYTIHFHEERLTVICLITAIM